MHSTLRRAKTIDEPPREGKPTPGLLGPAQSRGRASARYHSSSRSWALSLAGRRPACHPAAYVVAIGRQRARAIRVAQAGAKHHVAKMLGQAPIANRTEHFDPAVQVALHEVGAADVDLRLAVVAEPEDARVLQESSDDRPHRDAIAHAGHARAQAAHAAHDEVDRRRRPATRGTARGSSPDRSRR